MNAIERLIEADRRTPKNIAVVGDTMIDKWVCGTLADCQEGCPKFQEPYDTESHVVSPGGAANASRQLEKWRSLASLIGPRTRLTCLDEELGFFAHIIQFKTRYCVDGQVVFRVDTESHGYGWLPDDLAKYRRRTVDLVREKQFDAVLISDYDKGFLDAATIQAIIRICREQQIPVVADCKREPEIYEGAIFKGNGAYFLKRLEKLRRRDTQAVTTYGDVLPLVCNYGKIAVVGNPSVVSCVNHVGAGDCFAAHLTLALAHGLPLEDAAAIAHSAGRVYVQFEHGRPPTPEEIRDDFNGTTRTLV
jgi:bifunctional ADP-heptose synthase (sugar kinase/adenylyltransferase)